MPLWIVVIDLIMFVTWTQGLYRNSIAIRTIPHMKAMTTLSSTTTQHNEPSLLDKIIVARGRVTTGYGRGSRKLGFPTANLPHFDTALTKYAVNNGVYFGWLTIEAPPYEKTVYPCVANIGISPTFVNQENSVRIIEVHVLNIKPLNSSSSSSSPSSPSSSSSSTGQSSAESSSDFYGSFVNICLVGFIRPERKFSGIKELIQQITADVSYTHQVCSQVDAMMEKHRGCNDSTDRDTRIVASEGGTLASEEENSLFSLYHSFIAHYLQHTTSELASTITPTEHMVSYLISRWSMPASLNKDSTSYSSSSSSGGGSSVTSADADGSSVDNGASPLSDKSIGEWVSADNGDTFFGLIPTNYLVRTSSAVS